MAFGGAYKACLFAQFQKDFAMTYLEYSNLNNAKQVFETKETVKAALDAFRGGRALTVPVAPKPAGPARPPSLSIGEWNQVVKRGGMILYRAADIPPEEIAKLGEYRKAFSDDRRRELIKLLVGDPRGFVRSHISNNLKEVHSCSWAENCMDYCNTRAYVYKLQLPELYEFEFGKNATMSNIMRRPVIWADTSDRTLGAATKVAWDVKQDGTDEVDLLFPIEMKMIKGYKKKGTGVWVDPHW